MQTVQNKSDHQIKLLGYQILKNELGISGLIRFMQQFDTGHGNYVKDREEWQKEYDVDSLVTAINDLK